MKLSKSYYLSGIIAASLVFLGLTATFPRQVRAETQSELLVSLEFPPGPNRQPPTSTVGAAVRGTSCIAAQETKPLTALMSNRDNRTKTIAPNPTFFVYVPENNAKTAEFMLQDDKGREIASEEIPIGNKSGIFKIGLPTSIILEMGKNYQWKFSLKCESFPENDKVNLSGEIERVELSAVAREQLEKAIEPLQQAQVYAANNIWQETLTIVADQRCSNPKEWEELLNSVGLADFTLEPFVK
jgi:hypothetical protein